MAVKFGQLNRLAELAPPTTFELKPLDGGMDKSHAAWDPEMRTGKVRSPFSENTVIEDGVVKKAPGLTELGAVSAASDKNIMAVAEFERIGYAALLMRVLNGQLERFNGTSWLALSGALNGDVTILPSTLVANELFLVANGVDKIKKWDGGDGNPVADFSASSPKARYLTYFLGRVIAADILNGARDPEKIIISDDVDNSDFSGGNSDTVILEEDSSERPSPIMGLTTLFTRLYVYRENSIWIAAATGVPTAPLSFKESFSSLGVVASKSVDRYDPVGDIFLGTDMNIYVFSGGQRPIPVGLPIQSDLRSSISDVSKAYGRVDKENHQYWLIAPTGGSTFSKTAWIWDIDAWIAEGRLVWTRRDLPVEMACLGYGDVPTESGYIDDETRYIDEITEFIDRWQLGADIKRLVLGGTDGKTRYPDPSTDLDQGFGEVVGTHDLPQLGTAGREIWLDTAYIEYRSAAAGEVEVSVSQDGGTTYSGPRVLTLPQAPTGRVVNTFLGFNVEEFIPRIRLMGGSFPEIIGVKFVAQPRGELRGVRTAVVGPPAAPEAPPPEPPPGGGVFPLIFTPSVKRIPRRLGA